MRLLLLIASAGQDLTTELAGAAPAGAIEVVRSQIRLQKLDFWVRYPDYLAHELMIEFEKTPDDPYLLTLAGEILESDEPDLRRLPMLRHRFGAFEYLDDALAPLVEKGLIRKTQILDRKRVSEHLYWLLHRGRDVVGDMLTDAPALSWYIDRTRLVVALVDGLGGTQLKRRQYLVRAYADTPFNSYIPAITGQARQRLRQLRVQHGDIVAGTVSDSGRGGA